MKESAVLTIDQYKVPTISDIFYKPNYISSAEEEQILREVKGTKTSWKEVKNRKVQNHGGSVERGILLAVAQPGWLHALTERLHQDTGVFGVDGPNHVLLNYYYEGGGICNHQDGPIYHPGVCILSTGSSAVINFRRKLAEGGFDIQPSASLLLQPRSLLIFCNDAYHKFSHGIDTAEEDFMGESIVNLGATGLQLGDLVERKGERVSLTVRRVLKTRKNLVRL